MTLTNLILILIGVIAIGIIFICCTIYSIQYLLKDIFDGVDYIKSKVKDIKNYMDDDHYDNNKPLYS